MLVRAAAASITDSKVRIAHLSTFLSGCSGRADYWMEAANVLPFDQPIPCGGSELSNAVVR